MIKNSKNQKSIQQDCEDAVDPSMRVFLTHSGKEEN